MVSRSMRILLMRVEQLALVDEQIHGALVRLLDDAADLVVDLARHLVRVVGLLLELAPQERHRLVVAEGARAELLAHAVAHDHLLGGGRGLLEVVGGAGGDLAEHDLLGGAAAEGHGQRVHELLLGGEELVLGGQEIVKPRACPRLTTEILCTGSVYSRKWPTSAWPISW